MKRQKTHKALIIVDVQNDFCEGGALGVDGGHAVAKKIAGHIEAHATDYDIIIATRDFHDANNTNDGHFHNPGEEPNFVDTWPVHCVADTEGADYAPALQAAAAFQSIGLHMIKGDGEPAYSAFQAATMEGHPLRRMLKAYGITHIDVCGIATDYCVKATVLDALADGYAVSLLPGLHAGVAPETTATALEAMREAGASIDD